MCLTNIYELGSGLQKLLSTLKKNREKIPLEMLKSYYQQPYEALLCQINEAATAFVKAVLADQLILNPDVPIDTQAAVINQTIADSAMEKQMSSCISQSYSTKQLYQLALELREKVDKALWPYISLKTCLVFDMDDPDAEPVIYNTLTGQIYREGIWEKQDINLWGKFLIYGKQNNCLQKPFTENKENEYEYRYEQNYDCPSVNAGNRKYLPQTETALLGNGLSEPLSGTQAGEPRFMQPPI